MSQLQSQIEDLERYITFLQDAHPNKRPPPPSSRSSGLPLPRSRSHPHRSRGNEKKRSHDPRDESRDSSGSVKTHYPQHEDVKQVTFAESAHNNEVTSPPATPSDVIGPFLRHGDQAVPDYHLTLTQLDRAECCVDTARSEWNREGSLGTPLEGSKVSPPPFVCVQLTSL